VAQAFTSPLHHRPCRWHWRTACLKLSLVRSIVEKERPMTQETKTRELPPLACREDLAALLRVSLDRIDQMRRNGDLPDSFKTGRRRYWKREDIHAWIDSRVQSAAQVEGGAA
jgi:predicted DNA-binding transcriptional regulator AlpA